MQQSMQVANLKLLQECDGLRKQVEGVNEGHSYSACFEVVKLGQQVKYDYISSNESTGKHRVLAAFDSCP